MSGSSPEFGLKSGDPLRLGRHRFDPDSRTLLDPAGDPVPLRSQSASVLACLARHAGQILSKDALIAEVWERKFVSDDSLTQCIADIRRAIGDTDHRILRTYPKKGYRLVPDASPLSGRLGSGSLLAAGALAVVVALVSGWLMLGRGGATPAAASERPTLAILAFEDYSAPDQAGRLSDGIAEALIAELARYDPISVVARNSSFSFRDTPTDVREIGRALGADYLVEGSQQTDGQRLKVTVQLIDTTDGAHLWAHSYQRRLDDLFAVQAEIVRSIAVVVGRDLAIRAPPPRNRGKVSAYLLYQESVPYLADPRYTKAMNDKAMALNLAAIEADPDSPYGYLGMGNVYRNAAQWDWGSERGESRESLRARAAGYADKALARDPDLWIAHYYRGRIHADAGESEQAILRFRDAARLNPSASHVLIAASTPLLYLGRTEEGLAMIREGIRIDPMHPPWFLWQLGWGLWQADDCEAALEAMQGMAIIPVAAHRMLAGIHACLGHRAEAQQALQVWLAERPGHDMAREIAEYEGIWIDQPNVERWLAHMRLAGMPE